MNLSSILYPITWNQVVYFIIGVAAFLSGYAMWRRGVPVFVPTILLVTGLVLGFLSVVFPPPQVFLFGGPVMHATISNCMEVVSLFAFPFLGAFTTYYLERHGWGGAITDSDGDDSMGPRTSGTTAKASSTPRASLAGAPPPKGFKNL